MITIRSPFIAFVAVVLSAVAFFAVKSFAADQAEDAVKTGRTAIEQTQTTVDRELERAERRAEAEGADVDVEVREAQEAADDATERALEQVEDLEDAYDVD